MSRTISDSLAWAVRAARPMTRAMAVGPARKVRYPLVFGVRSFDDTGKAPPSKRGPQIERPLSYNLNGQPDTEKWQTMRRKAQDLGFLGRLGRMIVHPLRRASRASGPWGLTAM